MKTFKGGPNFKIEPGYYSPDQSTTSDYTTTGFYMKQMNTADSTVLIHTKRDTRYVASCGANIIGSLPAGGKVTVGEYGGVVDNSLSIPPADFMIPWSSPVVGENFQISSVNGTAGQFYVQYFVYQGQNTGTTPLPGRQTTSKGMETTTKSSGTLQFLSSIMLFLGFIGFL